MTTVEIEVPAGFEIKACGSCMRPVLWLANLDNGRTFAAVVDDNDRTRFELHRCRPLQAPRTWRALSAVPSPDQSQINAAGRALAEQALKAKTEMRTDEKEPTP